MIGVGLPPAQQHAPMAGFWGVLAKFARLQQGQDPACSLLCRGFGTTSLKSTNWSTASSRGALAIAKADWTGNAARGVAKEDRRRERADRSSKRWDRSSERDERQQGWSKPGREAQQWRDSQPVTARTDYRDEQPPPAWRDSQAAGPRIEHRQRASQRFNGAQQSGNDYFGSSQEASSAGRWKGRDWDRGGPSQGRDSRQGNFGGGFQYPERVGDPRLRKLKDEWEGDAVYGINPVLAALRAGRRELHTLYVQEGILDTRKHREAPQLQQAVRVAKEDGIPIDYLSKHDLNMLTDNSVHQGLLLSCSFLECEDLDDFPPAESISSADGEHPVWVALDEITDPQNLGAVLRSASFLGAAGVLTCSRNSAPLSPAVSKASAGALEFLQVHSCEAMQKTLERARDAGWSVLGGAAEESALPCSEVTVSGPTILVLGSEGKGLRTTVKRACTSLVRIDSGAKNGLDLGIDSLNVSVAAGILLHHLMLRQTR